MRSFWVFLWGLSFVFASCLVSYSGAQSQKDENSLQLQGFVWNHSTLNALVVTANNDSWWNPDYLSTSLRAIGQWNDAIAAFASNYSDFSYLSSLRIQPTISNISEPGFDIYITWTELPLSNISDEVGLSQIFPNTESVIMNSTTVLATHSNHGNSLDEVDLQNVALHELGHSLGLGHSNYTGDLMYAVYTMGASPESISTLDVYGVATLFAWETNFTNFYPINDWLNESSVILPSAIEYRGLPVSSENASPQTLANNSVVQFLILVFEILIHPEILGIILVVVLVLLIVGLISRRRQS
jgi:Matrixin